MGVPFNEAPGEQPENVDDQSPQPPSHDPETESSSEEANDDDVSEEEEGDYGYSSDDSENWEDPSEGGILTLVFRAAEHGDEAELEQLLPTLSVSINTQGPDGDTALHLACLYGQLGCARLLLDAGARPDLPDEDGAIPLHDAAAGGYTDLVELLLDRGLESQNLVNVADGDGDTPLHNACRGGSLEVVQLLLQRDADPTIKNNALRTASQLVSGDAGLLEFMLQAERAYTERISAGETTSRPDGEES